MDLVELSLKVGARGAWAPPVVPWCMQQRVRTVGLYSFARLERKHLQVACFQGMLALDAMEAQHCCDLVER